MISASNIFVKYGDRILMDQLNLVINERDKIGLVGRNGAGKSTLLKTLFGIVKPSHGSILIRGEDITASGSDERLKRNMAYVPEGRSNFPGMTVQDNLEMGAYTRKDSAQVAKDAQRLCERFPILEEKRTIAAGNLSGGQQQMLEIAMALMLNPDVLLIDEPTLGLAPILVTEVFDEIQKINEDGTTVVLVEQNAKRALEISHYAYVLELGQIRLHGLAQDLAKDEDVIASYLGER